MAATSRSNRSSKSSTDETVVETPVDESVDSNEETVNEETVTETDEAEVVTDPKERVPAELRDSPIFLEFVNRYIAIFDELTEYNAKVLAEKNSEWNGSKLLAKAKTLGNPDEGEANAKIKTALDEFERLSSELSKARQNLISITAAEIGVSLSAVADRDPELETELKEKRKMALNIGTKLNGIAEMMDSSPNIKNAIISFFSEYPLPFIGREGASKTSSDGTTGTPRYRVTVTVTDSDGNVKVEERGFTKAALALPKYYESGAERPTAETLRKAWESAGNNPTATVQETVTFEDNNLTFTIKKS